MSTYYEDLERVIKAADRQLGGDPAAAYDGSKRPQLRELTARERDVLCRVLTFVLDDPRYRSEELGRLQLIRHVLDPRRED